MEDLSHRDVIRIEIRGEQARETLRDLLNLVTSLDVRARELGTAFDSAVVHIVGPLKSIEVSTAQTVRELEALRLQIAGLGPAGEAGPGAVTGQFQRMRSELGLTASDVNRLRYELSQIGTVPMLPAPGRMAQAQAGTGAFAQPTRELGPTTYVTPEGVAFTAEQAADARARYEEATQAAEDYAATSRTVRQAMRGVHGELQRGQRRWSRYNISFSRHVAWLVRAMVIYKMLSMAMSIIGDVTSGTIDIMTEFDSVLARIGFITQRTDEDLTRMSETVVDLAISYGQLPTEALPAWAMITQATKDDAQQLLILEDANKLALMGRMDLTDATTRLIAIERQWNLEASEGGKILDIVAEAYRSGLIPIADMLDALARGGPLARAFGISLEEYAGIVLGVAEVTELSARETMNFLERISQRMFAPEAARQLWEQPFRIPVYQPGAPGEPPQRRPPIDVLRDVADIWGDLNDLQRANLALILSGRAGMGGYLAETMAVLQAWDQMERPIEAAGQSQQLMNELMDTLKFKIDETRGAWQEVRHELALTTGAIEGIKSLVEDVGDALRGWSFALETRRETGVGILQALWGEIRGLSPEQIIQEQITRLEQRIEYERVKPYRIRAPFQPSEAMLEESEEIIARLERQLATLRGERPIGGVRPTPGLITPMPEGWGPETWFQPEAPPVGEGAPPAIAPPPYPYTLQILEAEGLAWQDILALQDESARRVEEMIAANQSLYETEAERVWIEQEIRKSLADQIILLRDQEGVLHAIRGERAVYIRQLMREQETIDRMGVRRLEDFTPEMLAQVVQMAQVWEQRLAMMGFEEDPRRALLIGEDPTFWLTFEGSLTALRFAIGDLQDSMEDQTAVLRGHYNIPGGYVVPTPWDYYAATGSREVGPVNYPPEVLGRYYGFQLGGAGAGAGAGAGLFGGLGGVPTDWAATMPRAAGWDVGDWAGLLGQAGGMYGLDPRLLAAIMQVESGGDPGAIGAPTKWGRAQGLMQVMPFHAGRLQGEETMRDPWANIRMGAEILAEAIGRYGIPTGIAAYYGGVSEGAVTGPGEDYLRLVEGAFTKLFGGRPEGQEMMTVQGMPEMQRVLAATKSTQDTWLTSGVQQLILINQKLSNIYTAITQLRQPQTVLLTADPGQAAYEANRSGHGRGGPVIGHRPEQH